MNRNVPEKAAFARWLAVALYAVAMAWVEAAVVLDLRTMGNRLDPYQPGPLNLSDTLALAEVIREAATMIMLGTVGWLAGWNFRSRAAFSLVAFGVWDIWYYVFLRPLTGWPKSLLDWDVLFLIPLPWWGPVCAPMSIAALMILWGTLVALLGTEDRPLRARGWQWGMCGGGALLAVVVFMADAIRAVSDGAGAEQLRNLLPVKFHWALFGLAFAGMSLPALDVTRQIMFGDGSFLKRGRNQPS